MQLLYVDATTITEKVNAQQRPVFKGWTDRKLKDREQVEINYGGFGRGKLVTTVQKETGESENELQVNSNNKLN